MAFRGGEGAFWTELSLKISAVLQEPWSMIPPCRRGIAPLKGTETPLFVGVAVPQEARFPGSAMESLCYFLNKRQATAERFVGSLLRKFI
jgi:hypothetical protein